MCLCLFNLSLHALIKQNPIICLLQRCLVGLHFHKYIFLFLILELIQSKLQLILIQLNHAFPLNFVNCNNFYMDLYTDILVEGCR